MKYSEDQKQKIKNKVPIRKQFFETNKNLKKHFPVTVNIENGFYIIESKMNKK
jgi:hypothetical protein